MPRMRKVDPGCIHASNPFHECAEYCTEAAPDRGIAGFLVQQTSARVGRAKSAFVIFHRATTKPRLPTRAKTDLSRGKMKMDADCDGSLVCPRFIEQPSNERSLESESEKREAKNTEKGREISAAADDESGKGFGLRIKSKPQIGRTMTGFLIHRAPKTERRIEKSISDLNGDRVKDEDEIVVEKAIDEEIVRRDSTKVVPIPAIEDEEQNEKISEETAQSLKQDPIQFPPLSPIRLDDGSTAPVSKQRAGWSIVKACVERIREYLAEDQIDDEAVEVLLSSMERSEKDTGYSFDDWRSAVRQAVSDANKIVGDDIVQIRESIMADRELTLTEAQMSLNEEEIRLSKAERAKRDQESARRAIAYGIDQLKSECSSLRKQLVNKERDLNAKRKELKAMDSEQDYQQQSLGCMREAVWMKREIVKKAGSDFDTVEEDARAELDRLQGIVSQSISRVRVFEIGHRHPDFP